MSEHTTTTIETAENEALRTTICSLVQTTSDTSKLRHCAAVLLGLTNAAMTTTEAHGTRGRRRGPRAARIGVVDDAEDAA